MAPKVGYLLPTREAVMEGRPDAQPLLALAEQAEALGYDSVWIGDSVLARPRHEPLTMLAAVAGRTQHVQLGTAVLLPVLRNPVLLAHQAATLDQASNGRLILGIGIATDVPNIRAEFEACGVPFEKRVGRMLEGLQLARALWSGEPVTWSGRWEVSESTLGPEPVQKGGPPIWAGGSVTPALKRIARHFDGWFPIDTPPANWADRRREIDALAAAEGRDPSGIAGALYLTLSIGEDEDKAGERLDAFLASYYGARPDVLKKRQACYAGPAAGAAALMQAYANAGVEHFCLRFAGDHEASLETFAQVRKDLGW